MWTRRVAVLYQATPPPTIDGIRKTMKPGGYSDSGADIAWALHRYWKGGVVITPTSAPEVARDVDWVFPDTEEGILDALAKGANTLWLNTVLFGDHPLALLLQQRATQLTDIRVVGQLPHSVQKYDDKYHTNQLLIKAGVHVARSILIGQNKEGDDASGERIDAVHALDSLTEEELSAVHGITFPAIVKPIRGRGSQGVVKVSSLSHLQDAAASLLSEQESVESAGGRRMVSKYGDALILEEFLDGIELTITVMPPGDYSSPLDSGGSGDPAIGEEKRRNSNIYRALPPVIRFNHHDGVAPYNGVVAVVQNSRLLSEEELKDLKVQEVTRHCEKAAEIVGALMPIRIDCRGYATKDLPIQLFDLNMKPNMTGPGRPGREMQDNLCGIAARGIGWGYEELLVNVLNQAYPLKRWLAEQL